MARVVAGGIALAGTPFAALLLSRGFYGGPSFNGIVAAILLSAPGWFAYFALIWTAIGKRLPGDPFTTWIPCILVHATWFMLSLIGGGGWVSACAALAVFGGIAALFIEIMQTWVGPARLR